MRKLISFFATRCPHRQVVQPPYGLTNINRQQRKQFPRPCVLNAKHLMPQGNNLMINHDDWEHIVIMVRVRVRVRIRGWGEGEG